MIVQSGVGIQELWPIALIVVILFGAKRIPEMMKGFGEGMKEFKKATRETTEDTNKETPLPSENK